MSIRSGVCAPRKGLKSGRTIICYCEVASLNSSFMVGVCKVPAHETRIADYSGFEEAGSSAAGAIKFPQTVFSVLTVLVAASYNLANL